MATIKLSLFLLIFWFLPVSGKEKSVRVIAENPSVFGRRGETIELPLIELTRLFAPDQSSSFVVLDAKAGTPLPSQITADELLFQSDFKPGERREFIIRRPERTITHFPSLVDGRFVLPREDYAWENDRIAFRMYGPPLASEVSNGIDVWTKRVRSLVVEKWYRESEGSPPGKDTYHHDRGEGADFFSVGRTLGAGGSGIWLNGILYHPGVFSSWRTLSNGPIRVTFELTYPSWKVGGMVVTERLRISLDAGSNLNRIEVTADAVPTGQPIRIGCGLVKRDNTTLFTDDNSGRISLWGLTVPDTVNGSLGTGIVLIPSSFETFVEEKDQYLVIGRAAAGTPFTYYAGAGWTRSGDFGGSTDWNSYLDQFLQRIMAPLRISMSPQGD